MYFKSENHFATWNAAKARFSERLFKIREPQLHVLVAVCDSLARSVQSMTVHDKKEANICQLRMLSDIADMFV